MLTCELALATTLSQHNLAKCEGVCNLSPVAKEIKSELLQLCPRLPGTYIGQAQFLQCAAMGLSMAYFPHGSQDVFGNWCFSAFLEVVAHAGGSCELFRFAGAVQLGIHQPRSPIVSHWCLQAC